MKTKGKKDGNRGKKEILGRAIAEARKVRQKEDKKMLAMDFDEFKKAVIDKVNVYEDFNAKMLKFNLDQHDNIVDGLTGAIKNNIVRDLKRAGRNFEIIEKRLRDLEEFTLIMAIKFKEALQGAPTTFKERKGLAGCVSLRWGAKDEKALNANFLSPEAGKVSKEAAA